MTKHDEEIAALRAEVAELKAKVSPPKSDFVPMTPEQWRDEMHQLAEKRMANATPPSVVRDMAVLDDNLVKGIALRDARAPTGRPGMIPSTQGAVGAGDRAPANVPGGGTGWVNSSPLSPPPGINYVDALCIADDIKSRGKKP